MNIKQITIGQFTVEVVRKDIKNLRLGVYPPDGNLKMSVPLSMKEDTVRLFIMAKTAWIIKQQAKFTVQTRYPQREYISGETCYFKGRGYELNVIYHPHAPKVALRHNTHLDLYVPHNSQLEKREQVLIAWYRQALKAKIPELIHKWQPIIGVTVRDWGVKRMKTKWGTCNINAARIWLNLELIKKPEHCLEYVVVHEMVHLLERHHNARFTAYMDQFLPHWRSHKHELNQIVLNHTDWNY
ncbi:MAG: metal-dependent hydrolase [Methylococcaceae bacterium NSP1-2]|nr:M48 family metallopeptidase [Methylococcaceae bacterium]OYV21324.1 MAG: metal-dependent hydrolase [Methylococcaceae bacterium NSP1-2]